MTSKDWLYAWRARRAGVPAGWASLIIDEANKAGLQRSLALAIVETESSFSNVFGHDPVRSIVGGKVTKTRYLYYKTRRRQGLGMQGVGPAQLTWWEFQDEADRQGGCWTPRVNMRVAFHHLKAQIDAHGEWDGVKSYNGTGQAAENYARTVLGRRDRWYRILTRKAPR